MNIHPSLFVLGFLSSSLPPPISSPSLSVSSMFSTQPSQQASNPISSREQTIDFVDFWGTTISKRDDEDDDYNSSVDSYSNARYVPCVETLDLYDGPLPIGAYVMEGKQQSFYGTKRSCRIGMSVNCHTSRYKERLDLEEIVKELQLCIDSGFQSFELQHQNQRGLECIRKLRADTPAYVETHWSLQHTIPTVFATSNIRQQRLETRNAILTLLDQTKDDAMDSLQLVHNPQSPYTLDVLDHLVDLQREGLVRSIGVCDMPPKTMQRIHRAGLGHALDYQRHIGNLLFPTSNDICDGSISMLRLDDALAGMLLTGLKDPKQLNAKEQVLLRTWAERREELRLAVEKTLPKLSPRDIWQFYEGQVVDTLDWIALKHRVSASTVAIRWALEKGSDNVFDVETNISPIIVRATVPFEFSGGMIRDRLVELRKVFTFQLDDEDLKLLGKCSAPSRSDMTKRREQLKALSIDEPDANPEDGLNDWDRELLEYQKELEKNNDLPTTRDNDYPQIDFQNKALWL